MPQSRHQIKSLCKDAGSLQLGKRHKEKRPEMFQDNEQRGKATETIKMDETVVQK